MENSPVTAGVQEIVLESWREFFQLSMETFSKGPAFVYRGQCNYDWKLESTLERHRRRFPKRKNLSGNNPEFFDCPPLDAAEHLLAYKLALRGQPGLKYDSLSDDEYWALGQHHGLATPFLDWTRSPYVALYFAFEEEKYRHEEKDGEERLVKPEKSRLICPLLRADEWFGYRRRPPFLFSA